MTNDELRQRIAELRAGDDHMDQRDYMGLMWVADYVANAAAIADALLARLDQESERKEAA